METLEKAKLIIAELIDLITSGRHYKTQNPYGRTEIKRALLFLKAFPDTLKRETFRSLKTELMAEFPWLDERYFDTYYSDLYVFYDERIYNYLKDNYQFFDNIRIDFSNIPGQSWKDKRILIIPFANSVYWEQKGKGL